MVMSWTFFSPESPRPENDRYTDEYSSVPISALLAIDSKLMIPALRLIQFLSENGQPGVGCVTPAGDAVGRVGTFASMYELALAAIAAGESLDAFATRHARAPDLPYHGLLAARRVLPPLMHPDPSRCLVSGTGLTSRRPARPEASG